MIQYRNVERLAGYLQFFCQFYIVITGFQIIGRMVVGQDNGGSIVIEGQLKNLFRIDHRSGHSSAADVQLADHFVSAVEQEHIKKFVIIVGKLGQQQVVNIAAGSNFCLAYHLFGHASFSQLYGSDDADGFGFTHSAKA